MNSTPKMKYEVQLILDQLEKKGMATTHDPKAFRYFANKVRFYREKNQIWITTGCTIEQKLGIKHVIQINPDYKFERINDLCFKLVYRY